MAKIRPILMHKRSINGILYGRKTQTRRIMKPQPEIWGSNVPGMEDIGGLSWKGKSYEADMSPAIEDQCPYGIPGDRLWIKESWLPRRSGTLYKADYNEVDAAGIAGMYADNSAWKPSMFMPRWASRLVLEITKIRVEQIQDMTLEDCTAEGVQVPVPASVASLNDAPFRAPLARDLFHKLWDDTNGKGAWDRNDWVWIIEFKMVECEGHVGLKVVEPC